MKTITLSGLIALSLATTPAVAQQKSLREQLVGTWNFVVAEVAAPDGKKSFPFGETPKGILVFTAGGQFAQIHAASDLPKIASNNRLTGTPEEYSTIMRSAAEKAFKAVTTKPADLPPKTPAVPGAKETVSLRIDRDVLDFFQEDGPGWQDRINAALRRAAGK